MLMSLILINAISGALAGTILWDGRFNDMTSSTALESWSWSDETGPYQYYIHGDGNVTEYVNLDPTYKNPADSGSDQGVKITLDSTSYWEGQTMRRTELIPQTSAAIGTGTVYYHFSMKRSDTNAPSEFREHQIAFFESHFTEMKAGWISGESATSDAALRWDVSSTTYWNTTWEADVWHNIAYGIDFASGTVEFYHSTGADDLVLAHAAVSVSASSNGADWHLGVLELPRDSYTDTTEDVYFSGVYIESGDLTTSVSGPGGSSSGSSSSLASSAAVVSSTAVASSVASSSLAPTTPSSVSTSAASISSSLSSIAPTEAISTTSVVRTQPTTFSTLTRFSTSTSASPSTQLATVTSAATAIPTDTSGDDGDDDDECE